jgi:MSHA biogenesis protein MshG
MPLFQYIGRDSAGKEIKGTIEALSPNQTADQLNSHNITPLSIVEIREQSNLIDKLNNFFAEKPTLDDLIIFSRQMATLAKAGVPITRAIDGLVATASNKIFANTLSKISNDLSSGRELTHCLSTHPEIFPPLYINIIRVGEESGRLEDSFRQITTYLTLDKHTKESIKTATRYPTMVLIAISVAMVVINMFVIPTFAEIFANANAELPTPTKILLATSNFMLDYWPLLAVAAVGGVIGFKRYISSPSGRPHWDKIKFKLPVVGIVIKLATLGRFARSFSMALGAGLPMTQAITMVAQAVDNEYVAQHLHEMRTGIERGETLTKMTVSTGLFSPLVIQMMTVGEETGQVDELLLEVAEFHEDEVRQKLDTLSSAIEPIMIGFIGIMVLTLALGVFLPLWNMASTVG